MYQENIASWKFPRHEDICFLLGNQGLSWDMLRQVEVKEIVVGVSDILNILAWFWDCWRISQHRYQNNAVFMDNEEVSIPLNDVYRMAGFIDCPDPVPSAEEPELELYSRMTKENRWRQLPAKIMIGDRITDMYTDCHS